MRITGPIPPTPTALFFNVFRRQPPPPLRVPSGGPSTGTLPRTAPAPPSPKPPTRVGRDGFKDIVSTITGHPVANTLPSQSHAAPKSLAEVTQNLMVADRLHKAGVFSNTPQLGTVARDAFVNAGINGLVSAPMSIATYAGSAWTGEAIKGQYAAQTPLLPPVHQPAPSTQGAMTPDSVAVQSANVDTRLALAELRIEVVANSIMAILQGTGASALEMTKRGSLATGERLTMLETSYDAAEKYLKDIGEECGLIFRPYAGTSSATATDISRLDSLDKRFEAMNTFIGRMIKFKETELPNETTADTTTV